MNKPFHEEQDEERDDEIIGTALKITVWMVILAVVVAGVFILSRKEKAPKEELVERSEIQAPSELSSEVSDFPAVSFSSFEGIDFSHENGARGEKLLPETMGSGVAIFDYDSDGWDDLLFINATSWSNDPNPSSATQKIFRNLGDGSFEDVTQKAGLDIGFYGCGVAVGDVDNDGDPDLFISALGRNHFFINQNGVFEDQTEIWGLAGGLETWSTSAGFFDYDNDGDLDLFVCNYIQWSRNIDLELNFTLNGEDRAYGPPNQYAGVHSYLYRNEGAAFTDVSEEAGIQVVNPATDKPMGKALALTFADIGEDGLMDILVANDTVQNFVFRNLGDGTFREEGAIAGLAFDRGGMATGAMGMDAGYFDGQQRMMVSIANFSNESTSLYIQSQSSPWLFSDLANPLGIGSPSRLKLSFGLFFFDYDLDGREDLLQANGHLEDEISQIQSSQSYRQVPQLFWNSGQESAKFQMVPEEKLGDLSTAIVGRGSSFGDLDQDGDLDVVLTQVKGPPLVLRNDQNLGRNWLKVKLNGNKNNREGIGATVVVRSGEKSWKKQLMPTRSYLSQVPNYVHFGLGKTMVDEVLVQWPSGDESRAENPCTNCMLTIKD